MKETLTPIQIVEELNKYIISQDEAKKSVAISLRNRYRRRAIQDEELRKEITPKNIILIGTTGIGKTEIARRLAKIADAPFIKVEATKYTEVGYVGSDVESIIKDLVQTTYKQLKAQKKEELFGKNKYPIFEKIAKLLKPYDILNDSEKENIIKDIEAGKYDKETVEIPRSEDSSENEIRIIDRNEPAAVENFISNILGGAGKGEGKPIKMKVSQAITHLLYEEYEGEIDNLEIAEETIRKVQEDGIVFIDEIDKIVERDGNGSKGEVSRQGVQRDILPIVEGCTVVTSLGPIKTDHILFIAAGAFTQTSPSALMPELQGRFPIKVKLNNLTKNDYIRILTEVKFNLLEQYQSLLLQDNVELIFDKSGIEEIAALATKFNEKTENIGARRLHMLLESLLKEIMFAAPYKVRKKVSIDKKYIEKMFKSEYEEENLDKYIL